jgi:hypothetical protein
MRGGGVDYSQHVSDDISTKKPNLQMKRRLFLIRGIYKPAGP